MKDTMLRLAREGVAIILSSHLLSLLEEVCSHVLILKNGQKVVDGTLTQIRETYSVGGETTLEDVFFRATGDAPPPLPERPSPTLIQTETPPPLL
jgi:ABC-2 type transport system ATP-binding protein